MSHEAPNEGRVGDLLRRYTDEQRDALLRVRTDFIDAYAEFFETPQRPHAQKILRLIREGKGGIRLRAAELGGALYCTRRWLAEYVVASSELVASRGKAPATRQHGVGRRITSRRGPANNPSNGRKTTGGRR